MPKKRSKNEKAKNPKKESSSFTEGTFRSISDGRVEPLASAMHDSDTVWCLSKEKPPSSSVPIAAVKRNEKPRLRKDGISKSKISARLARKPTPCPDLEAKLDSGGPRSKSKKMKNPKKKPSSFTQGTLPSASTVQFELPRSALRDSKRKKRPPLSSIDLTTRHQKSCQGKDSQVQTGPTGKLASPPKLGVRSHSVGPGTGMTRRFKIEKTRPVAAEAETEIENQKLVRRGKSARNLRKSPTTVRQLSKAEDKKKEITTMKPSKDEPASWPYFTTLDQGSVLAKMPKESISCMDTTGNISKQQTGGIRPKLAEAIKISSQINDTTIEIETPKSGHPKLPLQPEYANQKTNKSMKKNIKGPAHRSPNNRATRISSSIIPQKSKIKFDLVGTKSEKTRQSSLKRSNLNGEAKKEEVARFCENNDSIVENGNEGLERFWEKNDSNRLVRASTKTSVVSKSKHAKAKQQKKLRSVSMPVLHQTSSGGTQTISGGTQITMRRGKSLPAIQLAESSSGNRKSCYSLDDAPDCGHTTEKRRIMNIEEWEDYYEQVNAAAERKLFGGLICQEQDLSPPVVHNCIELGKISSQYDMGDRIRVEMTLISGYDLVAKDKNVLGQRTTSDPYCEVFDADNQFLGRTATIEKTLDPVWNERFDMEYQVSKAVCVVKIWDCDIIGDPDAMGTLRIAIPSIDTQGEEKTFAYPIPTYSARNAKGCLHIKFKVTPIDEDFMEALAASAAATIATRKQLQRKRFLRMLPHSMRPSNEKIANDAKKKMSQWNTDRRKSFMDPSLMHEILNASENDDFVESPSTDYFFKQTSFLNRKSRLQANDMKRTMSLRSLANKQISAPSRLRLPRFSTH